MSREIDIQIQERVFGSKVTKYVGYGEALYFYDDNKGKGLGGAVVPHYSTDITAAKAVLDHLDKYCCDLSIEKAGARWYVDLRTGFGEGDTLEMAICLAALSAISSIPKEETKEPT